MQSVPVQAVVGPPGTWAGALFRNKCVRKADTMR